MDSEAENIEILQGIKPGLDKETAKAVLAKHKGDMQAAAVAILEGDTSTSPVTSSSTQWPTSQYPLPSETAATHINPKSLQNIPRPNTPVIPELVQPQKTNDVIDLTGEDDLSRALQMSLEPQATFGPSTRAPDPNWAVVPSSASADVGMSQEDQSYARAIEASLHASIAVDTYEELLPEERVRQEGRPVALRSSSVSYCYASVFFQALFSVPQVRDALLKCSEVVVQPDGSPVDMPDAYVAILVEILTYINLTLLAYLRIDSILLVLNSPSASRTMDDPGDLSHNLYARVTEGIEHIVWNKSNDSEKRRLFHFRYSNHLKEPNALNSWKDEYDSTLDNVCVRVNLHGTPETSELTSCLATQFEVSTSPNQDHQQQSIVTSSDVVAFHLVRHAPAPPVQGPLALNQDNMGGANGERTLFRYPAYMYLDPFMVENVEVVDRKRKERKEMLGLMKELEERRDALTWHAGRDVLKDLRSAVYYYEHVVPRESVSTERNTELTDLAMKLRKTLVRIENELEAISLQITKLESRIIALFDDPSLKKHRYDLRAVLMHDGLFGRNDVYSYIQHGGSWWKVVDYSVVDVPIEIVLTDSTGLHLGAGPYMLIYSRMVEDKKSITTTSSWPTAYREQVKRENLQLLNLLQPELAAEVKTRYTLSPPHSPEPSVMSMDEIPTYADASQGEESRTDDDKMNIESGP